MKNIFSLLFFSSALFVSAQKQITVQQTVQAMSKGTQPCYIAEIPQTGLKDLEKDWIRYLNATNRKGKVSNSGGEIIMRGADNKDVSGEIFNLYSKLVATPDGVGLTVWLTPNDTVFFNPQLDKAEDIAAHDYIRNFAVSEYYFAVKDELAKEKDNLEKMKDDLEKQIREEEKSKQKIAQNKRAIERAQDDLADNLEEQKQILSEIASRTKAVERERYSNADALKEAEKNLRDSESDKKKLERENESKHKKTDEWNKENQSEQRDIDKSQKEQKKLTDSISKQKQLIKDIAAKLAGIK